jgi:hypothetical protein
MNMLRHAIYNNWVLLMPFDNAGNVFVQLRLPVIADKILLLLQQKSPGYKFDEMFPA